MRKRAFGAFGRCLRGYTQIRVPKSLESLGVKKVVSESFAFEGGKAFKGVLSAECVENAGVPLKTNQEITGEE